MFHVTKIYQPHLDTLNNMAEDGTGLLGSASGAAGAAALGPVGWIGLAAGLATSAIGTSKAAKAKKKALAENAKKTEDLYNRNNYGLQNLIAAKKDKLYNLGGIFDRFESTGAFGDTDTLKNLRKAQSDFSSLAAGDFTGFEAQLRKSMSDSLINTVGSGSPVGAYAGLAADQLMNFRKQGIQESTNLSDFFSNESQKLLGSEFGIMDQSFNTAYGLDRDRVGSTNADRSGRADTVGVGAQAAGSALQQAGGFATTYLNNNAQQQRQNQIYDEAINTSRYQRGAAPLMENPQGYPQVSYNQTNQNQGYPTDPINGLPDYDPNYKGPADTLLPVRGAIRTPDSPVGGWDSMPQVNNRYYPSNRYYA